MFPETSQLPPDNRIITVSDFNRRVKDLLEAELPEVWIRGEISNFRRQSSGHCYFSLKDRGGQVSAVVFRGNASRLGMEVREGLQVVAFGEVSVYEPRGTYQIIVRMMLEDGVGRLRLEFERLKAKLAEEGLFDPETKRPPPLLPRTVGVVTSPTGAAIRDFLRILERRGWRGRVIVLPARVQGKEAAGKIAGMLEAAEQMAVFDLLVVTRGGGSLEDLWPFNEEIVARAVAACPIPIISAVGHEIDFTLSDFAADVRAETPSAAAELISSGYLEFLDRLGEAGEGMEYRVVRRVENLGSRLANLENRLEGRSPARVIENSHLRLDDLSNRFVASYRQYIWEAGNRVRDGSARLAACSPENAARLAAALLESLDGRHRRAVANGFQRAAENVGHLGHRLENLSPEGILRRGFVIMRDGEGGFVSRRKGLRKHDALRAEFADGEVGVEVTSSPD